MEASGGEKGTKLGDKTKLPKEDENNREKITYEEYWREGKYKTGDIPTTTTTVTSHRKRT